MTLFSKWFSHIAIHVSYFCFLRASDPSRFIKLSLVVLVVYFSFKTQKVEIEIEKYIHIYLNIIDPKIKIFRDFRVFVLRPIPKNENLEISEILQKCHNTVIWKCSFKNSWNAVQMTSISKWFSHIAIHVSYFCLLKASNPSRCIKWSMFLFILVLALKKLK